MRGLIPFSLQALLRVGALSLLLAAATPLLAQAAAAADAGPSWAGLSPAQQQILAPLSKDWQQLDLERKKKWLEIAARYPAMPAEQQARMRERMSEWARMTPQQRGQARANFQQAQQVPAQDRQAQWETYKALPKERKDALARQAQTPAMPASAAATGAKALRSAPLDAQAPKTNIVARTAGGTPAPRPVAPTVVQSGPGATTSLVSAANPPPVHQQSGKPKIEIDPSKVDRSTLLPKPPAKVPDVGAPAPTAAASQAESPR